MEYEKTKELERTHLEQLLFEITNKALILMIAPSGYGKTTLVRTFMEKNTELKSVWLSLGQDEVDEVWVWKRFCEKLSDTAKEAAEQLKELGLPQSLQQMDSLHRIICEYVKKPICIIFDDWQQCKSSQLNKVIERLVYEDNPYLHIMILSRVYPDISYEEMLLRGRCLLIDQRQLTLSREEIVNVFVLNGISMSEENLDKVCEYTDGWISAVYLTMLEYRRNGRFGFSLGAVHLLKTAVYDKCPYLLQQLLMKMSLLESFYLQEAIYVSECDIVPETLHEIIRSYGFIQYEVQPDKYRMHSLLRSVALLELEKSGCDKKYIFERAGEWREKNSQFVQAIIYYRKAGSIEKIFAILSGNYGNTILESAPAIVGEIMENTPIEIKLRYPVAYLTYIYYVTVNGDMEKGRDLYFEAKKEYDRIWEGKKEYQKLYGELLVLETQLQFNDLEKMNASMQKAYELLEGRATSIFNQSLLTYGTPHLMLLYHSKVGKLRETVDQGKEYSKLYMRLYVDKGGDWNELFEAEYELIKGEFEKALPLARVVCEKARIRQQLCVAISGYYNQLRSLLYLGRTAEFEQVMQELEEVMQGVARPTLVFDYDLTYSYVYACMGKTDKMAEWVRRFDLSECGRMLRNIRSGCTTYGMMLCRSRKWVLLETIADQMLIPYSQTTHIYVLVYANIFKAISLYYRGQTENAREYLKEAFALARPDEIRAPFIDASPELWPVMEACDGKSRFAASLKPYFEKYQAGISQFTKKTGGLLLTDRETELMELVEQGFKNLEISKMLNVAPVTVEKMLTGIYRKLKVGNRAAAVAKLREMR